MGQDVGAGTELGCFRRTISTRDHWAISFQLPPFIFEVDNLWDSLRDYFLLGFMPLGNFLTYVWSGCGTGDAVASVSRLQTHCGFSWVLSCSLEHFERSQLTCELLCGKVHRARTANPDSSQWGLEVSISQAWGNWTMNRWTFRWHQSPKLVPWLHPSEGSWPRTVKLNQIYITDSQTHGIVNICCFLLLNLGWLVIWMYTVDS